MRNDIIQYVDYDLFWCGILEPLYLYNKMIIRFIIVCFWANHIELITLISNFVKHWKSFLIHNQQCIIHIFIIWILVQTPLLHVHGICFRCILSRFVYEREFYNRTQQWGEISIELVRLIWTQRADRQQREGRRRRRMVGYFTESIACSVNPGSSK